MRDSYLFNPDDTAIKPDRKRPEPAVWIERLVLVDARTPDAPIRRDITFRRGLNIVRTKKRRPDDERTVGHSVGKTLLTRLIRYVLGENSFTHESVRRKIQFALPDAYVVARVFVNSQSWIVARPIGQEPVSRSWSVRSDCWEDALGDADKLGKYSDFTDALAEATVAKFGDLSLPHAGRPPRWLDLLAWLSRDQKCRYRHPNAWRDPETESGTAQLHSDDASLLVRMAMDLLDTQEKQLIANHEKLLRDRDSARSRVIMLNQRLETIRTELSRRLELGEDPPPDALFASVAKQKVGKNKASLERLLDEFYAGDRQEKLDAIRIEAAQAVAVTKNELETKRGLLETTEKEIKQREEADEQTYYANFLRDVLKCDHPDCPHKPENRPPGKLDPEREARIAECREHAQQLRAEIQQLERQLAADKRRAIRTRKAYFHEHDRVRTSIAGTLQAIGRCDYQLEQAGEYQDAWNELDKAQRRWESLDRKVIESQERQKTARESLRRRRQRLSRYFDTTLKALVSDNATGRIWVDGRGLHAEAAGEIADSGEAIGTFATVLGLDLACLIGSVCGIGHTPRLLIHDSPREADSEPEMYHQLFNYVAWLETIFGDQPPSFQYIVTTTTQPPADLAKKPYVCMTLHARREDGLLFKCRF